MEILLIVGRHKFVINQLECRCSITWFVLEARVNKANGLERDVSASRNEIVSLLQHVHQLWERLSIERRSFCEESVDKTA